MGHKALADWGFQFLEIPDDGKILDCGCGGGANIERMLREHLKTVVKGIDYSDISVEKSRKVNQKEINNGRCEILQASVMELPFKDEQFDLVTAFETVYFWSPINKALSEVARVLRKGSCFLISLEASDPELGKMWTERIDGMVVYTPAELEERLYEVGFSSIITIRKKGEIHIIAHK